MSRKPDRRGFILPLSVTLVVLLTISGAGFMHHDYLERLTALRNVDNQGSFYLGNAGIERSREVMKAHVEPLTGTADWNIVLSGASPYASDPAPDPLLCPYHPTKACIITPFQAPSGAPVTSGMPFGGTFDDGFYSVRVFNDVDEPGNFDANGKITIRAAGSIRGQQKLLEATVLAAAGTRCINCQNDDPEAPCPDEMNENMTLECLEGHEPASWPELPTWDPGFYRNPANLPCTASPDYLTGDVTLVPGTPTNPGEVQLQSGHCYFVTGNVTAQSVGPGYQDVVIFSDQGLLVSGAATFSNTILIALGNIQLQGNVTTASPTTYPALIAGGDITKGDASVQVYGNIYAVGDIGSDQHPWNPNQVEGAIFGDDVYLKAAATTVTDAGDITYYAFMPGFSYPPEWLETEIVAGSWRELQ